MSRRSLGFVVTAIGVIVVVIFALADQLGLGSKGNEFGPRQIVGVVVGAVIVVSGLITATMGDKTTPGVNGEE